MLDLVLQSSLLVLAYMTAWFILSRILKRNDVADVAWGMGFVLLAVFFLWRQEELTSRMFFCSTLVVLWGTRLTLHIYERNKGKREDYRYKEMRERWGRLFHLRSFLQVFMLQGILMLVISSSLMVVSNFDEGGLSWLDWTGVVVWGVGFFLESVSDRQLSKFLSDEKNKGKIMQQGLWRYSRHPNYFGEVVQWWGIYLIALSVPYGFLSVVSPLTITFLILKVSGIPLLERKMEGNPEFKKYKEKTSIFFPLPPKE